MSEVLRARLLRRVEDLPVLPAATRRLLALDPGTDGHFDEAVDVIESDPSLAIRVLSLANSAASSPTSQITSARGALARLGGAAVKRLVLAVSVSEQIGPGPAATQLWQHALLVGGLTRSLHGHTADAFDTTADEAYTVGLLHDIGHFVVQFEAPDVLDDLHREEWRSPEGLIESERSLLGLTHCDLGYLACRRWELPEQIGEVVLTHHASEPDPETSQGTDLLRRLVQFADRVMFPFIRDLPADADDVYLEVIAGELLRDAPAGLEVDETQLAKIAIGAVADGNAALEALGLTTVA